MVKQMFWNAFHGAMEDRFAWTGQDTAMLIVICVISILLVCAIYRRWRS